jgi:hypothetical protein
MHYDDLESLRVYDIAVISILLNEATTGKEKKAAWSISRLTMSFSPGLNIKSRPIVSRGIDERARGRQLDDRREC